MNDIDLDEDDNVFYGGQKKKSTYLDIEEEYKEKPQQDEPAVDVEDQIRKTRLERRRAGSAHDVQMLRQKAAEHSAQAAKFFGKYRQEEAIQVKHTQMVSKYRRKYENYIEKSKDVEAKAADLEASLTYLEGGKLERAKIKIAKLKGKSAKLISKSSAQNAKAAKHQQKAAAKKRKAQEYLEKSKLNEAEAKNFHERAERLERASGF